MVVTKDFPREYKFILGQKIKDEVVEIVVLIYRANSAENKVPTIELLLESLQVVELLIFRYPDHDNEDPKRMSLKELGCDDGTSFL